MTKEEFLKLAFENIIESDFFKDRPIIWFGIHGFRYYITTSQKEDGSFDIDLPCHNTVDKPCPVCKKTKTLLNNSCLELQPYKNQIFEKLISEPKLRLLWLYREYTLE